MESFLDNYNVELHLQNAAGKCILATKYPVNPTTLLEQVLCDADTYHLGTPDFEYLDELVWRERELSTSTKNENRIEQSIHFLQTHSYFTDYCRKLLTKGKERNTELLKMKTKK